MLQWIDLHGPVRSSLDKCLTQLDEYLRRKSWPRVFPGAFPDFDLWFPILP